MAAACSAAVILVIAASGGLGSRVTLQALAAGHTVNVLVRSHDRLSHAIGASNVSRLASITIGSATDTPTLLRAIASSTAVIECLGNADRAPAIQALISSISSLPTQSQPSLIVLGGLPALQLNAEGTPVTDHPRVAPMAGLARMHLATLQLLRASNIQHWAQVCPSRMTPSSDGRPSGFFHPRKRSVAFNRAHHRPPPPHTWCSIADLRVYDEGSPPLLYEDVAQVIVDLAGNVSGSGFSGAQVALALK